MLPKNIPRPATATLGNRKKGVKMMITVIVEAMAKLNVVISE